MAGPGKSYRRGITLLEAVRKFDSEDRAEAWFVGQRWPDGVVCPHCDGNRISRPANRKPMPFRCKDCRKHFSVTLGTLLHRSHIPLSKWAIAFYLYSTSLKGVSSMKLHRDLGITQKSAWFMAHRIRETWNDETEKFAGPVEVDETYIGGKEANKHESKKLRAGGGTIGKAAVVGMKDRASGQIAAEHVDGTDAPTLRSFIQEHTEPTAQVYRTITAPTRLYTDPTRRSSTRWPSTFGAWLPQMALSRSGRT